MRESIKDGKIDKPGDLLVKIEYDHIGSFCDFMDCRQNGFWGMKINFGFKGELGYSICSSLCSSHLKLILCIAEKANKESVLSKDPKKGLYVYCCRDFLQRVESENPFVHKDYTSGINYLCDCINCENRAFLGVTYRFKVRNETICLIRTFLCLDCIEKSIHLAIRKKEICKNILHNKFC
ncbi:MAG: hypothetical protein ACQEP6_00675 [Patescibacteria group bacterium]